MNTPSTAGRVPPMHRGRGDAREARGPPAGPARVRARPATCRTARARPWTPGAATTSPCRRQARRSRPAKGGRRATAGSVELGIPDGVVDRAVRVSAAAQVPVVVLGGAGLVVVAHVGGDVAALGRRAARRGRDRPARRRSATATATGSAVRGRRPAFLDRLAQAEPEESVVAGLARHSRDRAAPSLRGRPGRGRMGRAAPEAGEVARNGRRGRPSRPGSSRPAARRRRSRRGR